MELRRKPGPIGNGRPVFFLALLLLLAPAAWAQTYDYTVTVENASLSGEAFVVTLQQPTTGAKKFRGWSGTLYCSVAFEFTTERDGSLATQTAVTPTAIGDNAPATGATQAFEDSDSTGGRVLSKYVVSAGQTFPIEMRSVYMTGNSTAGSPKNFTIRTNSLTGRCVAVLKYEEIQ